ncbi:MAG: molybdopterin converting factor subunit 1 [Magnetococcales bacterium]|nr:molybdopterin converting factor subunit 1 [Magnetococcales bacterium]
MAHIFYFAWVREKMGRPEEQLSLPPEINTVARLLTHLRSQGEPYATVLADTHLRVAVNQTYASPEEPVADGDEIAIFPPVSGG